MHTPDSIATTHTNTHPHRHKHAYPYLPKCNTPTHHRNVHTHRNMHTPASNATHPNTHRNVHTHRNMHTPASNATHPHPPTPTEMCTHTYLYDRLRTRLPHPREQTQLRGLHPLRFSPPLSGQAPHWLRTGCTPNAPMLYGPSCVGMYGVCACVFVHVCMYVCACLLLSAHTCAMLLACCGRSWEENRRTAGGRGTRRQEVLTW